MLFYVSCEEMQYFLHTKPFKIICFHTKQLIFSIKVKKLNVKPKYLINNT